MMKRNRIPEYVLTTAHLCRRLSFESRSLLIVLASLSLLLPSHAELHTERPRLRVGIFPAEPLNYLTPAGNAQGLTPDLLRKIAEQEHWTLEFVPLSREEGRAHLQRGEIDLMPAAAYTPEQSTMMDFGKESILEIWGQVFIRPDGRIKTITDLAGRPVALQPDELSSLHFIKTAETLHIPFSLVEVATHHEALEAVRRGDADAAVVPQPVGLRHAAEYGVLPGHIHLPPYPIYFAAKKGTHSELLATIDDYLARWKADKHSFYYARLHLWMGPTFSTVDKLPAWLKNLLLILSAMALLILPVSTIWLKVLHSQVKKRTRKLEESTAFFEELTRKAPLAIAINSTGGDIEYLNERFTQIFGYTQEDIPTLEDWWELAYPDEAYRKEVQEQWSTQQRNPDSENDRTAQEYNITCKNGQVRIVEICATDIGQKKLILLDDITERKHTTIALKKSEEKYHQLFDNVPVGFALHEMIYDEQGTPKDYRYLEINSAFEQLTGLKKSDVIGHTVKELLPQTERYWIRTFGKVAKTGTPIAYRNYSKELGKYFDTRAFSPERNRFAVVFSDITAEKYAEAEIRQNRNMLELVLDTIPQSVFWKDSNGVFLGCNKQFAADAGADSPREIIGKTDFDISPTKQQAEKYRSDDLEIIQTGLAKQHIIQKAQLSTGQDHWIDTTKVPMTDKTGHICGVLGVYEDVTEYRAMEETLLFTRYAMDNSADSVFWAQPDAKLTYINKTAIHALKYPEDELLNMTLMDIDADCSAGDWDALWQEIKIRKSMVFESHHKTRDGDIFPVEIHAKYIRFGEAEMLFGSAHNITKRQAAKQALEESEQRFKAIFNSTYQFTGLMTPDGFLIEVNQTALEFADISKEEATTQPFWETRWWTGDARRVKRLKQAVATAAEGSPVQYEVDLDGKDGRKITIDFSLTPIFNPAGAVQYLVPEGHDITDIREAEKILRDNQQKISSMLRAAPAGIGMTVGRRLLECNTRLCDMTGYTREELLEQNDSMLYGSQEEYEWKLAETDRQVAKKGTGTVETQWIQKDGTRIDILLNSSPLNPDNLAEGSTFTALDITQRKLAEKEMKRLSTAIDQAAEAVVISNMDGIIEYVNPAFETITGYSKKDIIGNNARILQSGKHSPSFYQEIWDTISDGNPWQGQFINKRKNGEIYTEEAAISPVKDAKGNITGYVAVKRDITKETLLEEQYRQAQKMEAVGQLAGGIAHDFNNILQAILGLTEIVLMDLEIPPLQQDVLEIQKAAQRAAELTRQLLVFSRKQKIEYTPLNLNETVHNHKKMLRRLIGEDIQLSSILDPQLSLVNADPTQIEQIIMNLAINARHAMPDGGRLTISTENITIDETQLQLMPASMPGNFVCLTVADSGCGMTQSVKRHIFEPFFTTKGVGKGTGLGLSVVYGIVQQHKGWIHVESQLGKGTSFQIYLPKLTKRRDNTIENLFHKAEQLGLTGNNESILVVADDPASRKFTQQVLETTGHTVYPADDAEQAEILFREQPDITLLLGDLSFSDDRSILLAETLQQKKPDLRVLFRCGHHPDEQHLARLHQRKIAFTLKSFSGIKLLTAVRQTLDETRA